jgi:hypothetical protein
MDTYYSKNLKGRDHLKYSEADRRIILKFILRNPGS